MKFFIFIFSVFCSLIISLFFLLFFKDVLLSTAFQVPDIKILDFFVSDQQVWDIVKLVFVSSLFVSNFFIFHFIINKFFKTQDDTSISKAPDFGLLIGKDLSNNNIYIPEKSMYQNILVVGSIGSGKTSSAMYPFTKQLIKYKSSIEKEKLSFLILDVKGNYYSKVLDFAKQFNRLDDVIVIEYGGDFKYNPLDKPDLKPSVLANRLKTIMLLFSPNNTESYWLDKVEQVLESCIVLLRAAYDGYLSFYELNRLVCDKDYYVIIKDLIRTNFNKGLYDSGQCYAIYHSFEFLDSDYFSLDDRTYNLLKSEITRITNCFVSNYKVKQTFCPAKAEENFYGFDDVLANGKIVVLNMNVAEYKNLAKIIAAYLKLDFQTDVLKQLSKKSSKNIRPSVFISDEYQEYVTSSDADFYSQSRESKCINIVSTQSYTSILNTIKDQSSTKVIIQNLVNKLCFRTDDIFTIEDLQKQIGKEEKKKVSKTYSESSKESKYDVIHKNFISSQGNISESINTSYQNDYVFDSNFFTQTLKSFHCLGFLSTGDEILKPQQLQMIPYFKEDSNNEKT